MLNWHNATHFLQAYVHENKLATSHLKEAVLPHSVWQFFKLQLHMNVFHI